MKHPTRRRSAWTERVFVLGGPAAALVITAASPLLGVGREILALLWLAALAWTVFASLACALRCGIRHGDWSAFCVYDHHDRSREDLIDWSTHTGAWVDMAIAEQHEALMQDDDHLR